MFFRPEAIHGASGKAHIFKPFPERHRDIGLIPSRFLVKDPTILQNDSEGFAAIQAGKLYSYFLAGEEPADRQRFKSSLAEPFLLPLNSNAVLGGEIVKRGEGDDVVGSWVKPSCYSGGKEVMEGLPSFFHRKAELGSQFRIKRGLAGFYHTLHDDMKGLV
jgi:hypothetical protein